MFINQNSFIILKKSVISRMISTSIIVIEPLRYKYKISTKTYFYLFYRSISNNNSYSEV